MRLLSLILIFFINNNVYFRVSRGEGLPQQLLVVSFDGFRQDYMEKSLFLPWFNWFAKGGVVADRIQSVFPSNTFPNHWSIVTGMYAESHGIVANSFFEPKLNKTFYMSSLDVDFWNQAEPIWQTARRQGKKVAVSFWPGSAVQFGNNGSGTPNFYRPVYNSKVSFESRIEEIVAYLSDERVDLAFIYSDEPDSTGHSSGPDSIGTAKAIQRMDWYLSYLLTSLRKVNLGPDKLNIIICSDHGMANVTQSEWIGKYVDLSEIERIPYAGTVVLLQPKQGRTEQVMARLLKSSQGLFTPYLKKDLPADFHYSNNERITDIVVICKPGFYLSKDNKTYSGVATHGYDPREAAMRPFFMARGPAFKTGGYQATNKFETKDIYAIIAHVVGISAPKTNASFELVKDLISTKNQAHRVTTANLKFLIFSSLIILKFN